MIGVDMIGEIRRAYFEQRRAIKEIVRTLRVSRATVRKMSCGEAENVAGRVVCLFAILSRAQLTGSRAKAKAAPTIVPMYAAEAG